MKRAIILAILTITSLFSKPQKQIIAQQAIQTGCMDVESGIVCMEYVTYTPTPTASPIETLTPTETASPTLTGTPTSTPTFTPTIITSTNTPSPTSTPRACGFDFMPIYKDAQTGLQGILSIPTETTWNSGWSGTALTANTVNFYGDFFNKRKIASAVWVLAWNPNAPTDLATRVKLVGIILPSYQEVLIMEASAVQITSPVAWVQVITTALQGFVDAGQQVIIGHKPSGNGITAPLIYDSRLEILWKCP